MTRRPGPIGKSGEERGRSCAETTKVVRVYCYLFKLWWALLYVNSQSSPNCQQSGHNNALQDSLWERGDFYYAISLRMVVLNYGEGEDWSVYVCGRLGCVCVDG